MKSVLFAAGFAITYVTMCLIVMWKWLKEDTVAELSDTEQELLAQSLEQMRQGDLVDL